MSSTIDRSQTSAGAPKSLRCPSCMCSVQQADEPQVGWPTNRKLKVRDSENARLNLPMYKRARGTFWNTGRGSACGRYHRAYISVSVRSWSSWDGSSQLPLERPPPRDCCTDLHASLLGVNRVGTVDKRVHFGEGERLCRGCELSKSGQETSRRRAGDPSGTGTRIQERTA